jgi:DNA-binding transcriptional MocR family regulator
MEPYLRLNVNPEAVDTSRAFFGAPHLHGFKLGYAYPTPEQLESGIPRLAQAIARELESA